MYAVGVCMQRWNLFLSNQGFQVCMIQSTLAQSGAQQSTLFFKTFISFSILEDKVEHAIDVLGEATLAWQTCESISIFKDSFFFKT